MFEPIFNIIWKKRGYLLGVATPEWRAKKQEERERVAGQLRRLKNSIKRGDARLKSREFVSLVKAVCAQHLALKYQATLQEISREIGKSKHLSPGVRAEIGKFIDELVYMNYDWEEWLQAQRSPGASAAQPGAKPGAKVGAKMTGPAGKGAKAAADALSPASERALLLSRVEKFESFLPHLV